MFKILVANVEKWAEERGIYANATVEAQLLKMFSEIGELCDNVVKDKDHRDDIGDTMVCLINAVHMSEGSVKEPEAPFFGCFPVSKVELTTLIIQRGATVVQNYMHTGKPIDAEELIDTLNALAHLTDSNLTECLQLAYDEIKDRQGRMSATGTFIKESDDADRA